jgi:hypothetical protein
MAASARKRPASAKTRSVPKPQAPIRRFDVFAEVQRQTARQDGMAADQAKGHGLWLAKVVAARRFGDGKQKTASESEPARPRRKWKSLSGQPQTDKRFDREIVERMGKTFYRRVFSPAIRSALSDGKDYMHIRDSIRKDWKVAKA